MATDETCLRNRALQFKQARKEAIVYFCAGKTEGLRGDEEKEMKQEISFYTFTSNHKYIVRNLVKVGRTSVTRRLESLCFFLGHLQQ